MGKRKTIDEVRHELNTAKAKLRTIRRDTINLCAAVAAAWARHYPDDVFSGDGEPKTVDNAAARMARHVSRVIAEEIRRL